MIGLNSICRKLYSQLFSVFHKEGHTSKLFQLTNFISTSRAVKFDVLQVNECEKILCYEKYITKHILFNYTP